LASALTVPYAIAALVLCVAGVAKLRSPEPAARAVGVPPALVRGFAAGEVCLGLWALVGPGFPAGLIVAIVYAAFAATTLILARRGAACGCFGAEGNDASPLQSALSAVLAVVAAVSAATGVHSAAWLLHHSPATTAVLVLGAGAAVYAVVLAYSALPLLWRSWGPA
jgi:hypothetical protein